MIRAAVVLSLLAAVPQGSKPAVASYPLKNGRNLVGEVVNVQGDTVTFRLHAYDGTTESSRSLGEFTPAAVCAIRGAACADTFEEHFALAKFAAQNDMLEAAGREAVRAKQAALKGSDGAAQVKQLEKWAADVLEDRFHEALAANDVAKARHYMQVLFTRVPDGKTEGQRNRMIQELQNASAGPRPNAGGAPGAGPAGGPPNPQLQQARDLLADAMRQSQQASAMGGNYQGARQKFDSAINQFQAAARAARSIQSSATDPATRQAAGSLLEQIMQQGIQTVVEASHHIMQAGDYPKAQEYANRILQIDPNNPQALALQRDIQSSTTNPGFRWGFGWGWDVIR